MFVLSTKLIITSSSLQRILMKSTGNTVLRRSAGRTEEHQKSAPNAPRSTFTSVRTHDRPTRHGPLPETSLQASSTSQRAVLTRPGEKKNKLKKNYDNVSQVVVAIVGGEKKSKRSFLQTIITVAASVRDLFCFFFFSTYDGRRVVR